MSIQRCTDFNEAMRLPPEPLIKQQGTPPFVGRDPLQIWRPAIGGQALPVGSTTNEQAAVSWRSAMQAGAAADKHQADTRRLSAAEQAAERAAIEAEWAQAQRNT